MIQDDHHYRYNPQHFDMKLFIHTVLLFLRWIHPICDCYLMFIPLS